MVRNSLDIVRRDTTTASDYSNAKFNPFIQFFDDLCNTDIAIESKKFDYCCFLL